MAEESATPAVALFGSVGSICPYQPDSEKIESYLERVELYMIANGIPEDRHVPALLTLIGGPTSLLRSLVAPAQPQSKPYDDLVSALKKHFAPAPVVIAERFHFHRRALVSTRMCSST